MWKEYTSSIVKRLAGLGDSYQLGRIYHSIILTISHLNVPFYCIINNSHIDKDQNLIKDWALQYRIQKLIQGQYDQGLVDLMARVIVVTYLTNIAVGISGDYGSIGEGEQAAP